MTREILRLGASLVLICLISGCASVSLNRASSKKLGQEGEHSILRDIAELSTRWDQEPVPVGLMPQVFFDDALILEKSTNLARRIGAAHKYSEEEPIVKPEYRWEGDATGVHISVVTNHKGLFQMWYDCGRVERGARTSLGYAESQNGIDWKKPRLFPSFDNIVMKPVFGVGVYYDPHDSRGRHRYKAAYGTLGLRGTSSRDGVTFAYSRTGKRWKMYEDIVMLDDARSDTLHNLFWDDEIQRYRLYTRIITRSGRSSRLYVRPYVGVSVLRTLATALFVPIRAQPWVHVSDTPAPGAGQIYNMNTFKYGSIYVAQIAQFRDKIYYTIALSRDGSTWNMDYASPEHALVKHGDVGSFDEGMIFPASTAPIEVGDEWFLYYGASEIARRDVGRVEAERPYQRSIGLATIRKEGFLYLEAVNGAAELVTKSFMLEGAAIAVNADAHAGRLQVTVITVEEDGVEKVWGTSEPIQTDGVRIRAEWPERDLKSLKGRAIRLRFDLHDQVRLYGFQIED